MPARPVERLRRDDATPVRAIPLGGAIGVNEGDVDRRTFRRARGQQLGGTVALEHGAEVFLPLLDDLLHRLEHNDVEFIPTAAMDGRLAFTLSVSQDIRVAAAPISVARVTRDAI